MWRLRGDREESVLVQFYLKSDRGADATEIDDATGRQILQRLRHEGRKLVEVFALNPDGLIDRYQERTRRKLGSNAVASRTWLCETAEPGGEWGNGRYVPEPMEAMDADPQPEAVVLVIAGGEGTPETILDQLHGLTAHS